MDINTVIAIARTELKTAIAESLPLLDPKVTPLYRAIAEDV